MIDLTVLAATLFLSQAATQAVDAGKPSALDKMVCRRYVETGSLIKGRRVCKTQRDWDRQTDNAQNEVERLRPNVGTESGG